MLRRLWRFLRQEVGGVGYSVLGGTILVGAMVGAVIVVTAGGPDTANIWIDNDGGTCTRSSTPAAYVDASACSSIDSAYQLASCGDQIGVKPFGGAGYPTQIFYARAALSGCGSNVVNFFEPTGETTFIRAVRFGDPPINCPPCTYNTNGPDNVKFTGLAISGMRVIAGSDNVIFDNIDGGSIFVDGNATVSPSDITIKNSDLGPCTSTSGNPTLGVDLCDTAGSGDGDNWISGGTRVTFQNNVIHDYVGVAPDHYECITIDSGSGDVISGNWIYNCLGNSSGSIFLKRNAPIGDLTIENNWFGKQNAGCAIGFANYPFDGTTIVRFNSAGSGTNVFFDEGDDAGTGSGTGYFIGNIGYSGGCSGYNQCIPGATAIHYNLWIGTTTDCAGTGNTNSTSDPYVNNSNVAAANYHLSGSPGSTAADDFVPTSETNSGLATDKDGDPRPQDTNRDAGADER